MIKDELEEKLVRFAKLTVDYLIEEEKYQKITDLVDQVIDCVNSAMSNYDQAKKVNTRNAYILLLNCILDDLYEISFYLRDINDLRIIPDYTNLEMLNKNCLSLILDIDYFIGINMES